ncbi:sugar phosphate nucleotidyltransferase [Caldiplasma sukawensis]
MKGVITAAGLGSRSGLDGKLRKEMLPLYDIVEEKIKMRPVISMVIDRLRYSGIEKYCIITDPNDDVFLSYIRREHPEAELIFQLEKKGFADAVKLAEEFVSGSMFILNAGDGIMFDRDKYREMSNIDTNLVFIFRTKNPKKYGNVKINSANRLVLEMKEKPAIPMSSYGLAAVYLSSHEIFNYFDSKTEWTEVMDSGIKNGINYTYKIIKKNEWISVGSMQNYPEKLKISMRYCKRLLNI